MVSITLSVSEELKQEMEKFPEINWSEIARASIKIKILSFFASIIVTIVLLNNLLIDMIVKKLNKLDYKDNQYLPVGFRFTGLY